MIAPDVTCESGTCRKFRIPALRIIGFSAGPTKPFPEAAFQQTTSALPDLIHLNPAPGQKDTTPPPLVLLQAYGELAGQHPEYLKRYFEVLDQLERTDPGNPLVLAAIGTGTRKRASTSKRSHICSRALETGPPRTVSVH